MTFTPSPHLWTPQRRGVMEAIGHLTNGRSVVLYSPTGGGKTVQAMELMRWCQESGGDSCFYTNRTLLLQQTMDRFAAAGLWFGVRAAGFDDWFDNSAPIQICSADTERARVYQRQSWSLHPCKLMIVDEAHIQKGETMRQLIEDHQANGAATVLLTATPVGLGNWADELVVSGPLQEYRQCKALVPAVVKSIEQPDLRRVKRNSVGEYVLDGKKKKIYVQTIVGSVIDNWKKYNPSGLQTMLYAPGRMESVFFCEAFSRAGVSACHVDATDCVVDGKRYKLSRKLWREILQRYIDGDITLLCSRFKLREGIDVPLTYHAILATPIGSLASYLQTVGRVIRYSPETPDHVLITDHGGNYWRHGSPNADRPWKDWWKLSESFVSEAYQREVKDRKAQETIVCPFCKTERMRGYKCPDAPFGCGRACDLSRRTVIQENGHLSEVDGKLIKPRFVRVKNDTQEKWTKMFFAFRKKGVSRTFEQMYAFFCHENGYFPPRDLDYMPTATVGWCRKPADIEFSSLKMPQEVSSEN